MPERYGGIQIYLWSHKTERGVVETNWIGHILRRKCLLHDAIEGQMTEVKGVGRRRTQPLHDLRNRRKYSKLKIEKDGNDSLSIEYKYLS